MIDPGFKSILSGFAVCALNHFAIMSSKCFLNGIRTRVKIVIYSVQIGCGNLSLRKYSHPHIDVFSHLLTTYHLLDHHTEDQYGHELTVILESQQIKQESERCATRVTLDEI